MTKIERVSIDTSLAQSVDLSVDQFLDRVFNVRGAVVNGDAVHTNKNNTERKRAVSSPSNLDEISESPVPPNRSKGHDKDLQITGSFGTVHRADWNGYDIAVKIHIEQDFHGERFKEFCRRGSLYRLIHKPSAKEVLDGRRRLSMASDVGAFAYPLFRAILLWVFYILLRVADSEIDEDISRLKTTAVGLLNDLGCNSSTSSEDLIYEMCRYGDSKLHAITAFIRGVASQEVIKVLMMKFGDLESFLA
ncbi:hypothetical protein T459_21556 [Capsicum annuum]|uniref:Uncharacterized protein n=1 Tax=Capsicum annuum TaxID=4072 RepID=A0A2G2YX15_CAPAN|nr:hypothetical protein T459_21556 [Capsicum annuum]